MRAFAVLLSILIASCSVSIPDEPTYSFRDPVVVVIDKMGETIELSEDDENVLTLDQNDNEITVSLSETYTGFEAVWYLDGTEMGRTGATESFKFASVPAGTHQITVILSGEGEYDTAPATVLITVEHSDDPVINKGE